jgi:hypothetical protein
MLMVGLRSLIVAKCTAVKKHPLMYMDEYRDMTANSSA